MFLHIWLLITVLSWNKVGGLAPLESQIRAYPECGKANFQEVSTFDCPNMYYTPVSLTVRLYEIKYQTGNQKVVTTKKTNQNQNKKSQNVMTN